MGQKIQLVAACANLEGKKVTFKIYEKETSPTNLVEKDTALPVLDKDGNEVKEIQAEVKDGYAIAEIAFQKVDTAKYDEWDRKLDPDQGDLKTTNLFIKVSCIGDDIKITDQCFLEDKNEGFELKAAVIVYNIYHDHKIKRQDCNNPKKARYYYYESTGKQHFIGKTKVHSTKRHLKKNVLSKKKGDDTLLAYSKDIQSYSSGSVKFKFASWNSDSGRWYINPNCLAGLLGAMIKESIEDLGFNGFSIKNGNTAGGSSSHINGEKGDLRYLSTTINDNAPAIHLFTNQATKIQNPNFDYSRQEKFNEALYNFGWGRTTKMYSENFYIEEEKEYVNPKTKKKEIKKEKVKKLLSHCDHKMKLGENGFRHYHHIHLTGFDHSIIKKK